MESAAYSEGDTLAFGEVGDRLCWDGCALLRGLAVHVGAFWCQEQHRAGRLERMLAARPRQSSVQARARQRCAREKCCAAPRRKGSRLYLSTADCAFGVLDQDPSGLVGGEAPARVQQVECLEAGRDPEYVCGLGDLDAWA